VIESDENIRYQRMKQRGKTGEDISFETFCELEKMEESTVQKVSECMKLADIVIENNGTLEEFQEKLDMIPFERYS
jgi:dephospho-CoA kinase